MLGLGAATRIYVATGATDMRLSFNGSMLWSSANLSKILRAAICFYSLISEETG